MEPSVPGLDNFPFKRDHVPVRFHVNWWGVLPKKSSWFSAGNENWNDSHKQIPLVSFRQETAKLFHSQNLVSSSFPIAPARHKHPLMGYDVNHWKGLWLLWRM